MGVSLHQLSSEWSPHVMAVFEPEIYRTRGGCFINRPSQHEPLIEVYKTLETKTYF